MGFISHLTDLIRGRKLDQDLGLTCVDDGLGEVSQSIRRAPMANRQKFPVCIGDPFTFVAPRSFQRPLNFRKYRSHDAVMAQRNTVVTSVDGVLKPVRVEKISPEEQYRQYIRALQKKIDTIEWRGDRLNADCNHPEHDVYIEHEGVYFKAPQELLRPPNFLTRDIFLESVGTYPSNKSTPLDIAIMSQLAFDTLAKISFGILGGIAMIDMFYGVLSTPSQQDKSFIISSCVISNILSLWYAILLVIVLIALFDWLDMGHMDLRHLKDTLQYRTLWIVSLFVGVSFVTFLATYHIYDSNYLNCSIESEYVASSESQLNPPLQAICSLIAWVMVVLVRCEDLFLYHLQQCKKYDANDEFAEFKSGEFKITSVPLNEKVILTPATTTMQY